MVDTQSRASKQGEKGRYEMAQDPPGEHSDSLAQSLSENLVDCPSD